MAVKAIDLVRRIRDKHYEETRDFSEEKQIRFIKDKSKKLRKRLKIGQPLTADHKAQKTKV